MSQTFFKILEESWISSRFESMLSKWFWILKLNTFMTWKFVILCKRVFGADDRYDIWTTRTENRQGSTKKKPKNFIKLPQKHFPQGHVTQTNMLTRLRKTLQVTLNVETYETCHKWIMSSIDKLPYLVQLPQEKMFCVSFTEPWLYPMLYINNHIGEEKRKQIV